MSDFGKLQERKDSILKGFVGVDDLQKGKALPIGTIKKRGPNNFIKTASGWKYHSRANKSSKETGESGGRLINFNTKLKIKDYNSLLGGGGGNEFTASLNELRDGGWNVDQEDVDDLRAGKTISFTNRAGNRKLVIVSPAGKEQKEKPKPKKEDKASTMLKERKKMIKEKPEFDQWHSAPNGSKQFDNKFKQMTSDLLGKDVVVYNMKVVDGYDSIIRFSAYNTKKDTLAIYSMKQSAYSGKTFTSMYEYEGRDDSRGFKDEASSVKTSGWVQAEYPNKGPYIAKIGLSGSDMTSGVIQEFYDNIKKL